MIKVIDDYVIDVDEMNYIVKINKHKTIIDKKTGKVTNLYEVKGYYNNLVGALKGIRNLCIANTLSGQDINIAEAIDKVSEIFNNPRLKPWDCVRT